MPKIKKNDLDVEEKPQNTNAANKTANIILIIHFLMYRNNEKDRTHPRPIKRAISLISPNFDPNLENCK